MACEERVVSAEPTPASLGWQHVHAAGEPGAPALLLLHGTGGDENDLIGLGRALRQGATLISPRGRVLEHGMRRFFTRTPGVGFHFPDLAERTDELAEFVRAAQREYSVEPGALWAVGFSNGANVAANLMLRHPGLLRGGVLLRALLPAPAPEGLDLTGTRVLVAAGTSDQMIPRAMSQLLIDALRHHGADVTEQWTPSSHGLVQEDVLVARDWLASVS